MPENSEIVYYVSMEYVNRIQRTIDFIEDSLRDEISIRQLADIACFSSFHFCRMFQLYTSYTVMDYVRQRRLAASVRDLKNDDRYIVDIAVDYSFGSRDSYSRAFRRMYGTTPGECRKQKKYPVPRQMINLGELEKTVRSKIMIHGLKMKLMEIPEILIAGYQIKTNNKTNYSDIPAFWEKLFKDGNAEDTWKKLAISGEYGKVCLGYCTDFSDADGSFHYVIGWIVENDSDIPSGLVVRKNPPLKYAVFTTPVTNRESFATVIQLTTRYVFHDWLPLSEYEFDSRGSDMEWYDQRCEGEENICMDICVPVIRKK